MPNKPWVQKHLGAILSGPRELRKKRSTFRDLGHLTFGHDHLVFGYGPKPGNQPAPATSAFFQCPRSMSEKGLGPGYWKRSDLVRSCRFGFCRRPLRLALRLWPEKGSGLTGLGVATLGAVGGLLLWSRQLPCSWFSKGNRKKHKTCWGPLKKAHKAFRVCTLPRMLSFIMLLSWQGVNGSCNNEQLGELLFEGHWRRFLEADQTLQRGLHANQGTGNGRQLRGQRCQNQQE